MSIFTEKYVHMSDKDSVLNVVDHIIEGGKENLQVVADFDMTLTKSSQNGKKCSTCHGIIDDSRYLSQSFHETAEKNRAHYQSIEFDNFISKEDKYPHMVKWWTTAHDLLVGEKRITRTLLTEMAQSSRCFLRSGCVEMFDLLHTHRVPLLIFSAGIGDLIREIILRDHVITDNMKIVSNFMEFDETGLLSGFQGQLIHTFSKNESALKDSQYLETLHSRHNIVLLGDTLADIHMADGAIEAKNILKIGFLNSNVEESLEVYKAHYDVVIEHQESMDVVYDLLRKIVNRQKISNGF